MNGEAWQIPLYGAAALVSLIRLVGPGARRPPGQEVFLASREADAVHIVMNIVMATMVSTLWSGPVGTASLAALGITAALLAMRLVPAFRHGGGRAGTLYHLAGVGAMLYAGATMPAMHDMSMAMPGMAMADHGGLLPTMLGWLFLADGIATFFLVTAAPRLLLQMEARLSPEAGPPGTSVAQLRLSAIPHVVMDLGMALMLL